MEIDDMPLELCTPENIIAATLDNGQLAQDVMKSLSRMGFVIVPKEPTNTMICAALDDYDRRRSDQSYSQTYRAMIDAANN